ncbi:hypothetical protein AT239_06385 [Bartonella henselae]|nr:hypothetical protein AT240_02515 [Bartonella henselae]OLL55480.1 hypothetical protein AT239_06385 [Bartonella henselae]
MIVILTISAISFYESIIELSVKTFENGLIEATHPWKKIDFKLLDMLFRHVLVPETFLLF